MILPTAITAKLDQLDAKRRPAVVADILRLLDRELTDQARDRAIIDLTRQINEQGAVAKALHAAKDGYMSTEQARGKLGVGPTTWKKYVKVGLIAPVDPTAGKHQFWRGDIQDLLDMPSGERRRRVREWKEHKKAA